MKADQATQFTGICRLAVLCLFLILSFSGCGSKKETAIYRFIDHLEKKNILSSPLADLDRHFPLKSQKFRADEFRPVTVDGQSCWAVATLAPVACPYDYDLPPDLTVSRNGEKLIPSLAPLKDSLTWRWFKGERNVDFPETGTGSGGFVPLQEGESLERMIVLPPGIALFEIFARSGNPESYLGCIEVEFNGNKTELCVGPYRSYKFADQSNLGSNRLKITFKKTVPRASMTSASGGATVELDALQIGTCHDLILISRPPEMETLEGDFELRYPVEPVDKIIPVKKYLSPRKDLAQTLDPEIPAGKDYEVVFQPSVKEGRLAFWLGEKKIASTEIVGQEWTSSSFQAPAGKKPAALRLSYERKQAGPGEEETTSSLFIDSIIIPNPLKSSYLSLYHFKDFRILDLGIGENPYLIKKKLKVRGESSNSIFVPPVTRLEFQLKIPQTGILSFGYGLLESSWAQEGDGVTFEILIETSGKRESLFSTRVDPYHNQKDRKIFDKDLNLAPYWGKVVTLWFETQAGPERENGEGPDDPSSLAFWINPLIYQPHENVPVNEQPASVILISLDTLGANHLGCYGYQVPTSPHIDELARESALFLQAYSSATYTLPSHTSLFTSLFPPKHQVFYLDQSLTPDIHTLTEVLRSHGYYTAALTDGGQMSSRFGFSRGFEYYQESRGGDGLINSAELLYQKASSWINSHRNLKFFLFLHTYQTHNSYKSPPPFGQMFLKEGFPWKGIALEDIFGSGFRKLFKKVSEIERQNMIALYDGEIRYTDETLIKPLLYELKRLRLYDQTMLIVTADHGEAFGEHGYWMHSWSVYNEVMKIPLMIKFPRSQYRGRKIDDFVGMIDILPTVLAEAKISPSGLRVDGESLLNTLNHKKNKPRPYLIYQPANMTAAPTPRRIGLIRDPYKLVINEVQPPQAYEWFSPPPPRQDELELYNLRKDPAEKKNLVNQERNVIQDLMRRVRAFLRDMEQEKSIKKLTLDKDLEERLRALGYIK